MSKNITKIFKKKVSLNEWEKVNLGKFKDFYLIGIKGKKKSKKDILDPKDVKKLKFEIAVETGLKDKYITVSYLNLNFDDISSSNVELNKITGYTRHVGGPSKFFIRVIEAIDNTNTSHKEGKINIKLNINAQNLG